MCVPAGVPFDVRRLNVGDFTWIAREKSFPIPGWFSFVTRVPSHLQHDPCMYNAECNGDVTWMLFVRQGCSKDNLKLHVLIYFSVLTAFTMVRLLTSTRADNICFRGLITQLLITFLFFLTHLLFLKLIENAFRSIVF